jgi:hypothetical protein
MYTAHEETPKSFTNNQQMTIIPHKSKNHSEVEYQAASM